MKQILAIIACVAALYYFYPSHADTLSQDKKFNRYISNVRKRAKAAGVSEKTLNMYLTNLQIPTIKKEEKLIHTQKKTAVRSLSFDDFMQRFITKKTIYSSRERYHQYKHILDKIQQRYHVQPQYLIAIWAIESGFGKYVGKINLVHALVNLGFAHQSSQFYQEQIRDGLIMLDKDYRIPEQLKSTFDAGMGQPQFEPSTYLMFAVDFDNDSFKNIWTSVPDSLASIANFLNKNHWNKSKEWGFAVQHPSKAAIKLASIKQYYPMRRWISLGIKTKAGTPLVNSNVKAALLLPVTNDNNTAFLVLHNFKVLMRWNNSIMESLAIAKLADSIK